MLEIKTKLVRLYKDKNRMTIEFNKVEVGRI